MEKKCAGSQGPQRAALLDEMEEEEEAQEKEAANGTTFKQAKIRIILWFAIWSSILKRTINH